MSGTIHFVQTFKKQGRRFISGPPKMCKSPDHARLRALREIDRAIGVVVFSVTGEHEFGECDPPVILERYGEIPWEFA